MPSYLSYSTGVESVCHASSNTFVSAALVMVSFVSTVVVTLQVCFVIGMAGICRLTDYHPFPVMHYASGCSRLRGPSRIETDVFIQPCIANAAGVALPWYVFMFRTRLLHCVC